MQDILLQRSNALTQHQLSGNFHNPAAGSRIIFHPFYQQSRRRAADPAEIEETTGDRRRQQFQLGRVVVTDQAEILRNPQLQFHRRVHQAQHSLMIVTDHRGDAVVHHMVAQKRGPAV